MDSDEETERDEWGEFGREERSSDLTVLSVNWQEGIQEERLDRWAKIQD